MYHSVALLAVPHLVAAPPRQRLIGNLFAAGIALFSGSLYALVLTDKRKLGIITPFGGVSFIAAWVMLALSIV